MAWSLKKLDLRWYELVWALLPLGLSGVGGAIGGACGAAAAGCNIKVMRSRRRAPVKYLLTGLVSLAAVGSYVVLAKTFLALIGPGTVTVAQVDRELRKSELYVAIARADPVVYDKIRAAMVDGLNHGKSKAEVAGLARPYITSLAKRYGPVGSEEAVLAMARIVTLEIDQIGARSADACFEFLFPRPDTPADLAQRYLTVEAVDYERATLQAVLTSGIADPQRVPSRDEILPALQTVGRTLVATYGRADVAALAKPLSMDHATVCAMTSALYKTTLSLPRADAVPLLRFLFAQTAGA